jgi:solute carrier family 13 (sodium-dependent dicarboxylate transporter), member 2/3/5
VVVSAGTDASIGTPHHHSLVEGARSIPGLSRHAVLAVGAALGISAVYFDWAVGARAGIIAGTCLLLWLAQLVPVWVPTLVLWAGATVLLPGPSGTIEPGRVLAWFADPVLVLFIAGFALAAAAERQGADRALAALTIQLSRGEAVRLVVFAAGATALLSMWISNIAAAALLYGTLRPVWEDRPVTDRLRRAILLAVALGANLGGIGTPIGTGPNGIAMAAVSRTQHIDFLDWMLFAFPLALGLVLGAIALVLLILKPKAHFQEAGIRGAARPRRWRTLAVIFALTVALWLSEPLHGLQAPTVALGTILSLFLSGVLVPRDAAGLDWATLALIAGGIGLGRLLDAAGLLSAVAEHLFLPGLPSVVRVFGLALLAATLSSLMSNTGTAAVLVPLSAAVDSAPSTAIVVAIACSLGMPFGISTPPNAMAISAGLGARDLMVPGLILMLGGCALLALTGTYVLAAFGFR